MEGTSAFCMIYGAAWYRTKVGGTSDYVVHADVVAGSSHGTICRSARFVSQEKDVIFIPLSFSVLGPVKRPVLSFSFSKKIERMGGLNNK